MLSGRTFHCRATFDWLEAGAFLTWRMRIEELDSARNRCFRDRRCVRRGRDIYFDVRGPSREYRWTVSGNGWRWWRNAPDFSQRMILTILDDGQKMEWKGEVSKNGANWEPDLQLTYMRAR